MRTYLFVSGLAMLVAGNAMAMGFNSGAANKVTGADSTVATPRTATSTAGYTPSSGGADYISQDADKAAATADMAKAKEVQTAAAEDKRKEEEKKKEKECSAAKAQAERSGTQASEANAAKKCQAADYTKTQTTDTAAVETPNEAIPTTELTQAQKDAYKQYRVSMLNYEQKNLAGRPGLENVPTKIPAGFANAEDSKKIGLGKTSGFGHRESPCTGCSSDHMGNDYSFKDVKGKLDLNKEIAISAQGKVVRAEYVKGYGNTVVVDHGRYQTQYSHLASMDVKVGDKVGVGQVVGIGGSTGVGTAAHLHYGMRDGELGNAYIDPSKLSVTPATGNNSYSVAEGGKNGNIDVFPISNGNYGGNGTQSNVPVASNGNGNSNPLGSILAGVTQNNGNSNPVTQIVNGLFGNSGSGANGVQGLLNQLTGGLNGGLTGGNGNSLVSMLAQMAVQKLMESGSGSGSDGGDSGSYETNVSPALTGGGTSAVEQASAYVMLRDMATKCGTNMPTSADAIMLMVKTCQSASS